MSTLTIESESNSKQEPAAPPTKGGRKASKKAKPAKKAPAAKKPVGRASDRTNKKAEVIAMRTRAKGATLAEIIETTGFQKSIFGLGDARTRDHVHQRIHLLKNIHVYPCTVLRHFNLRNLMDLPKCGPVLAKMVPMLRIEHHPSADPNLFPVCQPRVERSGRPLRM